MYVCINLCIYLQYICIVPVSLTKEQVSIDPYMYICITNRTLSVYTRNTPQL